MQQKLKSFFSNPDQGCELTIKTYYKKSSQVGECTISLSKKDITEDAIGWALESAAENGRLDMVKFLLSYKLDGVDCAFSMHTIGRAVQRAAKNKHSEVVNELLKGGRGVSFEDRGWTLRRAAKNGDIELVKLLGEDVSQDDKEIAIKNAAKYKHKDVVELLFTGEGWSEEVKGVIFAYAILNYNELLEKKAFEDPKDMSIEARSEALKFAVKNLRRSQEESLICDLLDNGPVSKEAQGWALSEAAKRGRTHLVKLLLEKCANVSQCDKEIAITNAIKEGHTKVVELLFTGEGWSEEVKGLIFAYATLNRSDSLKQKAFKDCKNMSLEARSEALKFALENFHRGEAKPFVKYLLCEFLQNDGPLELDVSQAIELVSYLSENTSNPKEFFECLDKIKIKDNQSFPMWTKLIIVRVLVLWFFYNLFRLRMS